METKNDKRVTFGRYLSGVRLEKGIELPEIAKQIKVNIHTLHLIENGDHEKLPDPVFTKGFIRAYADAIGADRETVLSLYKESYAQYQNTLRAEADLVVYGKKFWLHLSGALGLLLVVMGVSFFSLTGPGLWGEKELGVEASGPLEAAETTALPDGEKEAPAAKEEVPQPPDGGVNALPGKTDGVTEESAEEKVGMILLKITAVEDTRIKIIIDDASPKELLLKKGDVHELKAKKRYNILIGNATGIKLELNGEPVDIPGKSGQVATLMLP